MKKLLSLLASFCLTSSIGMNVIACRITHIGEGSNDYNYEEKDIPTIILDTYLGEINFHSLTGNDTQTQTEIINQVRTLNPNVGDAQINILNINRINSFATISIQGYIAPVTVFFRVIISINLLITYTDLGDINFYSFSGNDAQTQTEIINQVRTLNSNVGDAQINISNINPIDGTATISALGFNGALTITFTPPRAIEAEPLPISFSSGLWSSIQLQDGTILVGGGSAVGNLNSFLATIDLSGLANPQIKTLIEGPTILPATPRSIFELQDGTILVAGGTGNTSFLATIDLSDSNNPQFQILSEALLPSMLQSITQLQDGTILAVGGLAGNTSFLASVDLSNSANPQFQILSRDGAFPGAPASIIQLDDGTILVAGGTTSATSFLASINLSNSVNPIQMLEGTQNFAISSVNSLIQLQDGTILVAGGSATNGSNSFLASVNLSDPDNPQFQTLAQGSTAFPSNFSLITELQDGTILVGGGTTASGENSFLRVI